MSNFFDQNLKIFAKNHGQFWTEIFTIFWPILCLIYGQLMDQIFWLFQGAILNAFRTKILDQFWTKFYTQFWAKICDPSLNQFLENLGPKFWTIRQKFWSNVWRDFKKKLNHFVTKCLLIILDFDKYLDQLWSIFVPMLVLFLQNTFSPILDPTVDILVNQNFSYFI